MKEDGTSLHKKFFTGKEVCPPNCPDRCIEPNCHNVNTCARWAAHMAEREKEYENRRKRAAKRLRPYD